MILVALLALLCYNFSYRQQMISARERSTNSSLYARALSPVKQAGRADGLCSSDAFPLHRSQILLAC